MKLNNNFRDSFLIKSFLTVTSGHVFIATVLINKDDKKITCISQETSKNYIMSFFCFTKK